jgi:glyoxylase-like metal-dependent hydrolase (beta-lactamase superfamily II)
MDSKIHPIRIEFQLPVSEEKKVERVVYSYVVLGEQPCLIDTGPVGGQQAIVAGLADLGRSAEDIDLVINTHEHPDHIGGNTFFQEAAQPVFACHSAAVRWIETLDVQFKERPIFRFYSLAGQPVAIQQKLEDGQEIDLGGGITLKVIFTPGHSPGSISLFCPQDGSLIVADAIQPVDRLPLYMDLADTRRSLQRLLALEGVQRMYLAWVEKPYTGSEIKDTLTASLEYLDQVDATVKAVAGEFSADATAEEITREVLMRLGLEPPPVMPMTVASIKTHLP